MRSGVVVSLVVVAAAVGSLGCFDGLFGDGGDGGGLGGLLDPKPPAPPAPQPLCEGFALPKAAFEPLERVALEVRLREALAWEDKPALVAKVVYKGLDEPLWSSVELEGAPGQERYVWTVPPSINMFEPADATVSLEVISAEGGGCGEGAPIKIAGLKAAPGTLERLVPKTRRLLELEVGRFGMTLDELRAADPASLPDFMQPLVMAVEAFDGAQNPNALVKLVAGRGGAVEVQERFTAGLGMADALLAAAKVPEEVDEAIARLEQAGAGEMPEIEALRQPMSGRGQALEIGCDAVGRLKIGGPETLSRRMREAAFARWWANELDDSSFKTVGGSGRKIIGYLTQAKSVKGAEVPLSTFGVKGVRAAKAINPATVALEGVGLLLTVDYHKSMFIAGTYPSQLTSPSVRFNRELFEEDYDGIAIWSDYMVTARSEGFDGKDIVGELSKKVMEGIIGKGIGAHGGASKLSKQWEERSGLIGNTIKDEIQDSLLGEQLKQPGQKLVQCAVPARSWGPFDLSQDPRFFDVLYLTKFQQLNLAQDGAAVAEVIGSGEVLGNAIKRGFRAIPRSGAGMGRIVIWPMEQQFPPASNRALAMIKHDMEVKAIEVELKPSGARAFVEPGGKLIITAEVKNAIDKKVLPFKILEGEATCAPIEPDALGFAREECTFGSDEDDDFPVRVMATSRAQGGARNPDEPRQGFETYRPHGTITINPDGSCLAPGTSRRFEATVEGITDKGVTWTSTGEITASGDFSADKKGVYTITATSKARPKVVATASVTVGACKCPWSARVMGPLPYVSGGFTDITAIWEPTLQNLQITATDKRGLRFVVIAPGVPWGAVGVFGAKGNAALPGAAGVVDSFDAPALLKDGGLTRSELSIESWDGNKLKGRYQGSSVFFASQALDAPLAAELELQFDMVVSTTGVLDVLTNSCIEED